MVEGSSALAAARKAWRERDSDGKACLDEDGTRVECVSVAEIVVTESALPAGLKATFPADLVVETPRVLLYEHVWGVEDPDA